MLYVSSFFTNDGSRFCGPVAFYYLMETRQQPTRQPTTTNHHQRDFTNAFKEPSVGFFSRQCGRVSPLVSHDTIRFFFSFFFFVVVGVSGLLEGTILVIKRGWHKQHMRTRRPKENYFLFYFSRDRRTKRHPIIWHVYFIITALRPRLAQGHRRHNAEMTAYVEYGPCSLATIITNEATQTNKPNMPLTNHQQRTHVQT